MALDKPTPTDEKTPAAETPAAVPMTQMRRWLVFGSNVIVALLLATVVMVAAVWLSGELLRGKMRADWTSSGQFSLSPRSKLIVKGMDANVQLTLLYPDPERHEYENSEAGKELRRQDLEQYRRLKDLLGEYTQASAHITTREADPLNPVDVEGLMAQIREKFKADFQHNEALLREFGPFQKRLETFVAQEIKKLSEVGSAQPPIPPLIADQLGEAVNDMISLSKQFQLQIMSMRLGRPLALPDEKSTVEEARAITTSAADLFKDLPTFYGRILLQVRKGVDGQAIAVPAALTAFLEDAPKRFEPVQKDAAALKAKFEGQSSQKFEQIEQALAARARGVFVETDKDIQFLTTADLWINRVMPGDMSGEESSKAPPLFVAETAITGTVASLVQPEKPAVLFVTFGGPASGYGGGFSDLADKLRKSNLLVEDWDLMTDRQMPRLEHATKTILIFVPPAPVQRGQQMPPTPEAYAAAMKLVRDGTPAILMGEPGGLMSPTVPYTALFTELGATLKTANVAVHRIPSRSPRAPDQTITQIDTSSYPDHPITRSLAGLPTAIAMAAPLEEAKELPAGVTVKPILVTPGGTDYWATSKVFLVIQRRPVTFDPAEDLRSPVTVGVAVTRPMKDGEQRAVLFGGHFAEDQIAQYKVQDSESGRVFMPFPGNTELFLNSVLWAAGSENLIAAGPEVLRARLIGELGSWNTPLKIILIGGLPAVVLLIGIGVYIVRRR